ncbi:formate dehydrogenase [Shewanella sp. JM162201]|uniref:Formate dehydrogenase n=1 Tax=Shewanella jiangmenensis TaxID=2837387 RepID=A0ABS5V3N1_9GAMM|nr:formate dehydrogenase [Shewanella jiangmenensis]MBT1445060.1 formate dehydrogenase [Shewanella jiangmenensis]
MNKTPNSAGRRAFLKAVALGSVAGSAVLATGHAAAKPAAPAQPQGTGYRETDHVRRYYASLRGE